MLLSAGGDFTDSMWQIITDGLQRALDVTTYCTRQLMLLFKANSENFYGDIGQVKVATRKDCSPVEFIRMWHLAQQVKIKPFHPDGFFMHNDKIMYRITYRGQKYCTCPAGRVTYNFHSSCKHMHLSFKSVCNKEHKGVI